MPFTIGGSYVPKSGSNEPHKKIKIVEIKRKGKNLTQVLYLRDQEAKSVLAYLKKACHTGGTYKDQVVELQGHLKEKIKEALKEYPQGDLNL